MIVRPHTEDLKIIGLYTGKIITGVGLLMLIPLVTALALAEWNPAVDFAVGFGLCQVAGWCAAILCRTPRDLSWAHGLVVTSFSWILATALGAVPLWLSGHYGSFLDSTFDVMSGFTTTGLALVQDLDHLGHGHNMWRHLLQYAGGQGIIVIALTFLFKGTAGAYKLYVGEGKDERLLPNVIQTTRAIWLISLVYLALGTLALSATGMQLGQEPLRAFLHGLWITMAGWATGGFAPQSYNTLYYHSPTYDLITAAICILGSFNFALHWAVWKGSRSEIRHNIETVAFAVTMTVTMIIATAGLVQSGIYPEAATLFRKMFYIVTSGHTGTGFSTVYARSFIVQWGDLAMLGVILAMAIGGGACSTCGGFKEIRVGLIFTSLYQDVRRMISPESAVILQRFHHITTRFLEDGAVRMASVIVLSYVGIYSLGCVAGVFYGYGLIESLFDAVSAGANVGLSCGVTSPSMPAGLKAIYIFVMWAGRLEFMSIFALMGYSLAFLRGR